MVEWVGGRVSESEWVGGSVSGWESECELVCELCGSEGVRE